MSYRTRRRIATVALAPVGALAAWALTQLVGIDLTVSGPDGPTTVGPTSVAVVALVAALGAWLVVLLFDRYGRHPRGWWAFVGSTTLAVSGLGPSYRSDGLSALALMFLHFVAAIVVILGFAGTLPVYRRGPQRSPGGTARREPAR